MKLVLALGVILSLSCAHTALSEELAHSSSMVHKNDSLKHWNNEPRLVAQLGHATGVSYAAFSPDGKMVVTAGHDSVAILWEFTSGKVLRKFVGHDGDINSVVFSPDSRFVITGSNDKTARIWDVENGNIVQTLVGHMDAVNSVVFSSKGNFVVTGSDDKTARLWETHSGNELKRFEHTYEVKSALISSDGNFVLTGGFGKEKLARLWNVNTEVSSQAFEGYEQAALSANGLLLYMRSGRSTSLWDFRLSKMLDRKTYFRNGLVDYDDLGKFDYYSNGGFPDGDRVFYLDTTAIAIAPDGRRVAVALKGFRRGEAIIWDVPSGKELLRFKGEISSIAFSPKGDYLVAGTRDGATIWSISRKKPTHVLQSEVGIARSIALSPDGRYLATNAGQNLRLWNLTNGYETTLPAIENVRSLAFSPNEDILLVGGLYNAQLWDIGQKKLIRSVKGKSIRLGDFSYAWENVDEVAFSPTGDTFATGIRAQRPIWDNMSLWDVETGEILNTFPSSSVFSLVFSPNGSLLATASANSAIYDVSSGKAVDLSVHLGVVNSLAFSNSGNLLLTSNSHGMVKVWDVTNEKQILKIENESKRINSVVFSPDDKAIVTGELDVTSKNRVSGIRLYDISNGELIREYTGHMGGITALIFSMNKKHLISSGLDGTVRFWDWRKGGEVIKLMSFSDDKWVVTTPNGRFDTNNLEESKGLHWVMPDDPLRSMPLEIFMRDYYEPRLLPRVLAGEKLPEVRPLAELNRAQPMVQIVGVERETGSCAPVDTVAVTVEVSGVSEAFGLEGKKRRMDTGVYDLRLFRDGQLVEQEPSEESRTTVVAGGAQEELKQWRKERLVVALKDGKRQIVFKGIRLPRRAGLKEVQFSAYAFNEDRVKSETAPMSFSIPAALSPRVPRAYIVSVGVNAFEDSRWDLSYAANDAKQLGAALKARLETQRDERGQSRYEEVVCVELTSEAQVDNEGKRHITRAQASKAQIEAVLKTLAGKPIRADALKGIDHAEKLRRANPEDLVIIALSSHGEVDKRGRFYMLPQDIGSNPTDQQRRKRAISSDELSEWLRGLDAIDMVMIIDACHSAASVQNKEFKPGPMGNRGLGQLAYDKGIRILAATQIDQYALETQKTQLGLLSYALVREGLEESKANYKPEDQAIWLSEWLSYASERVPGLYQDWREGKLKGCKKGELLVAPEEHPGDSPFLQQPALFDFARNRDVIISQQMR